MTDLPIANVQYQTRALIGDGWAWYGDDVNTEEALDAEVARLEGEGKTVHVVRYPDLDTLSPRPLAHVIYLTRAMIGEGYNWIGDDVYTEAELVATVAERSRYDSVRFARYPELGADETTRAKLLLEVYALMAVED
jgi:hypothetical protein